MKGFSKDQSGTVKNGFDARQLMLWVSALVVGTVLG